VVELARCALPVLLPVLFPGPRSAPAAAPPAVCTGLHIWDLPAAIPFIRDELSVTLLQAGALLGVTQVAGMLGGLVVALLAELIGKPWVAGLAFASYTIQWMTVVGFLPTIYSGGGLTGIWPGVLSAVVGGVSAAGWIGTAPLLRRGVPVGALLIGGFAAMAATSLLTFAIHWAALPAGIICEVMCVSAFSLLGGVIPATLFRIAVDLAPPAGSAPATIGLMQQIFNAGSVADPAIAAWLVTRTGGDSLNVRSMACRARHIPFVPCRGFQLGPGRCHQNLSPCADQPVPGLRWRARRW
jgi:hypothetical protein